MWQGYTPNEARSASSDLFYRQEESLNYMHIVKDLADIFYDDPEMIAVLNSMSSDLQTQYTPRMENDFPQNTLQNKSQQFSPMNSLFDQLDRFLEDCEIAPQPYKSAITKQQVKALSKRHLLMMILDLQEKLESLEEENKKMLRAFQAGYSHGKRTG